MYIARVYLHYGAIPVVDSLVGSPDGTCCDLYFNVTANSYGGGSADVYDEAVTGDSTGALSDT